MVTVVDYKPLDNISGFQILTDNNQKFLAWDIGFFYNFI